MAEYEFTMPDFLEGNTADEIQERMMQSLPSDIDDMPGGFPFDFTMPTAIEKSELLHFYMPRLLMLMFPQYAWGEWLDLHGHLLGLPRRAASFASGNLTIRGENGTVIPKGFVFCVPANGDVPAIEFAADEDVMITAGSAIIPIVATESGKPSNVMPKTITLAMKPIKGIVSIINEEAITGGTEKESDPVYRTRIMAANTAKGTSFVGNIGDYTRWAMEVSGVGGVTVIPTWDGAGTVKLVIIDEMGQPANERILQAVFDHIMQPDNPLERKAPICVELTVSPPEAGTINYSGVIKCQENATVESIKIAFMQKMSSHYSEAKISGVLRYTKACSILSTTPGVVDYSMFQMNGGTENIMISPSSYPLTGTVDFAAE